MPAPANNDEFLDLIRKSGVVEESRLQTFLDRIKAANATVPDQPTKFASWLVRDGVLTYFQAEQILQGKYKRFTIGKYKVLEKLGVGGMGQVFLCEHKMMRRRVAIKVLPIAKSDDDAARDRFYREARAVAALDHPNIVRAYDVDQDENLHFLVMEFVDGTNLHDLVKKHGPLDVTRACHFIYASAAGLEYANGMGIVHRDIKPGNILVDRAGIVRVLDMGLALFFKDEEDDGLTRTHDENVLGTADYLAPEQAIDSHTVDIRADIYSLGGTFYYLLTGSAPFPDGTVAQKLMQHQMREPKPIRERRPEVPEEVAAIVAKMMKKDAAERYATPAALMADLVPFVQSPIAPPTEAEMPKFSRAAVGTVAASRGVPSGVMTAGSQTSLSMSMPVVSFPSTINSGSGSQTSAVIPEPKGQPAIWEDIAADTTTDTTADTAPTPERTATPPPSRKTRTVPAPSKRLAPTTVETKKKKKWLIPAIAAGVLVVALGGYFAFSGKTAVPGPAHPGITGPAATGTRTLYVTKGTSPAADLTFPTLAAALKKTAAGDTIQLLDDPHEEPPVRIVATSPGKLKDVTIEAGNAAKMVTLKLPTGSVGGKRGVFELAGTDGLKIRNLTLDAGGKLDYCLKIQGQIDGLLLENLILRGATTADVFVEKAFASPDRPARFENLLVRVDSGNCDGIQFIGDGGVTVSNIHVENCRFLGKGWNAVHFRGPARNVDIRNNRIAKFDYGVQLEGPENAVQVKIISNTFHSIKESGLWLSSRQPNNPPSEVVFERNYFTKSKELLRAQDNKIQGLKAADNARDKETKNGHQAMDPRASEVNTNVANPDSEEAAAFLLIDEKSPLRSFGPNKLKIGAQ